MPVLGRELIVLEHALGVGLDLRLPLVGVLDRNFLSCCHQPGLEGPLRPDGHAVMQQEADVGVPAQEPDQFDRHPLEVDLLRSDERKAIRQVVPDLAPEDAGRTRSGAVILVDAARKDIPKEILVRCNNCSGHVHSPQFWVQGHPVGKPLIITIKGYVAFFHKKIIKNVV